MQVLEKYPSILAGISNLEGRFPSCGQGSFTRRINSCDVRDPNEPENRRRVLPHLAAASFEVALEAQQLSCCKAAVSKANDVPEPTFNSMAVRARKNFVEHFIDSTGVISWRSLLSKFDYEFCEWDFSGSSRRGPAVCSGILEALGKEVVSA